MFYPLMGGTDCLSRLRGTNAEPEEGDEHGGHDAPGAWRVAGCVSVGVCTPGQIHVVWSLTAPLLFVFVKVSCNQMNVTNIFADYEVRKEPNHRALMGTGRMLRARGGHRAVGGRWEAWDPACPGVMLWRSKEPTVSPQHKRWAAQLVLTTPGVLHRCPHLPTPISTSSIGGFWSP